MESPPTEPIVVALDEWRLVIHLEPIPRNQLLLLLTVEQSALSSEILQQLGLTHRESQILRLVAQEKANADIAKDLNLKTRTVEKHLENVLATLGASSRFGALVRIKELAATIDACVG